MVKKTEQDKSKRELPSGARSFSRTGEGLTSFVEGEEIRGKFIHMKEVEIKDRRTKEKKHIRVYVLQLMDGSTARIGSRALLDDAFDEVCSVYGGVENLSGKEISFCRGEDVATGDGNPLGTYEIIVY
ncbi:hypothetical protein L0244_38665 [bacterium]|nr:hypothetical protein [bacterium]